MKKRETNKHNLFRIMKSSISLTFFRKKYFHFLAQSIINMFDECSNLNLGVFVPYEAILKFLKKPN